MNAPQPPAADRWVETISLPDTLAPSAFAKASAD